MHNIRAESELEWEVGVDVSKLERSGVGTLPPPTSTPGGGSRIFGFLLSPSYIFPFLPFLLHASLSFSKSLLLHLVLSSSSTCSSCIDPRHDDTSVYWDQWHSHELCKNQLHNVMLSLNRVLETHCHKCGSPHTEVHDQDCELKYFIYEQVGFNDLVIMAFWII